MPSSHQYRLCSLFSTLEKPGQSGSKHFCVCKGADQSEVVVLRLEKLQALRGARDKQGFLFIAAAGGVDQDRLVPNVISTVWGRGYTVKDTGWMHPASHRGHSLLGRKACLPNGFR